MNKILFLGLLCAFSALSAHAQSGSQYHPNSNPTAPSKSARSVYNDPSPNAQRTSNPGVYTGSGQGSQDRVRDKDAADVNSGKKSVEQIRRERQGNGATKAQ